MSFTSILRIWPHPARSLFVLACLFRLLPDPMPGARAQSAAPAEARITSIRLATPSALLIEATLPAEHYAILEEQEHVGAPFRAVRAVTPTVPGTFRTSVATVRTRAATVFRIVARPLDAPSDLDADGMDDVYEARRSHVLDPLDPSDAARDSDGDGDSNLTEYLSQTESAPPPSGTPVHYATLDELRRTGPAQLPPLLHLGGFNREGDGWGGWFVWLESDGRPPDNALRVAYRNIGPGRLERVVEPGDAIQTAWWRPSTDPDNDAGPALQNALEAMAARPIKRLVFQPGRYRVRSVIAYSDPSFCPLRLIGVEDFDIDGAGATLWSESDGELLMLKDCHRGTIRNLAVEGSGSDRSLPDGNFTAIGLLGVQSDLAFYRCRVSKFMHGISHLHGEKTSTRVTLRECHFEDGTDFGHGTLPGDGAAISGIGDDWLVENCFFHECGRGVEIENTAKAEPIRRVIIRGNRMTQVRNLGIMAFLGGPAAGEQQQSDIVLRDNVVIGSVPRHLDPRGQVVPVMNIALNGGSRWIIQGNLCEQGDFAGISLYANQAPVADSVISGNIVSKIGGSGIQVTSIQTLESRGVLISNNRISECYGAGILLAGDHHTAQGNLIENTSTGVQLGHPDETTLAARYLIVRGNSINTIPAGLPAILLGPSVTGAAIVNNDIVGATLGIRDLSAGATLEGNRFQDVELELEIPQAPEVPGGVRP